MAGGPGIIANGMVGLVISANYFEGNSNPAYTSHRKDLYPDGLFRVAPECWGRDCSKTNVSAPNFVAAVDIMLNGASSWHEGSSDYKHWPKLRWRYGTQYPCKSVLIEGSYHRLSAAYPASAGPIHKAAVLAVAADGVDIANSFINEVAGNNVSLIACGAIPALFQVRNLKVKGCTQSCAQSILTGASYNEMMGCPAPGDVGGVPLVNLMGLPSTTRPPFIDAQNGPAVMSPFHTWQTMDSPSVYSPVNLAAAGRMGDGWTGSCTLAPSTSSFYQSSVRVTAQHGMSGCQTTIRNFSIADRDAPADLPGRAVYMLVKVRALTAAAQVTATLAMDCGDGLWHTSAVIPLLRGVGGWQILTHHGKLLSNGQARFGLALGCGSGGCATPPALDVAIAIVAPIGHEWSSLL